MKPEMTGKERWLAAMTLKPVDRIVYWPKIAYSYQYHRRLQKDAASVKDYLGYAGADHQGWVDGVYNENYVRGADFKSIILDENTVRQNYITTYGTLTGLTKNDVKTATWHPVEYPVKTIEDIKIMTEWFLSIECTPDSEKIKSAQKQYNQHGDTTVTTTCVGGAVNGKSPLMNFLEYLAGIDIGHYLLADYPAETSALLDAMHQNILSQIKITAEYSPAEVVYLYEDSSTLLTSPTQYQEHCFDYINDYGKALRDGGKLCCLHMCGHLKQLLPMLNQTVSDIFEALSPPTVGDTDLLTARKACPGKAFMGGTNAAMWMTSPDDVINYLNDQFSQLPHLRGLIITSGGEMPPSCDIGFIRRVGEFVKSYPII